MLLAYVVPSAAPIMTQQPQRLPSMIVEACMLTAAEQPPQAHKEKETKRKLCIVPPIPTPKV